MLEKTKTKTVAKAKAKIETAVEAPPKTAINTSKTGIMTIPGVKTLSMTTLLIGTSPVITHKFSSKLIHSILDKHMGKASEGRDPKDPEANFQAARYRLSDGSDGIPAGGIKAAFSCGFPKGSGVTLRTAKSLRVHPDDLATNLVRIITTKDNPRMRTDVVRNASGVVDIRHRPEFWPWGVLVGIQFLPSMISPSQLLQGIAIAGHIEGLCEWRPGSKESKSGTFGTWRLATAAEIEQFEDGKLFDAAELIAAE
ncbi:MAG TPA: hypothetical protein VGH47_04285 [Xanthobacteraceae bacterium]|jgi:hypothetical protein